MNWVMIILSVWFFLQPTGSESVYCKEHGENASATYRSDSTVLSAECLSVSAVFPGEWEECGNSLNGVSMLLGHLLTYTAQIFSDVPAYRSPEAVKRVTGKELTGLAANGKPVPSSKNTPALAGYAEERFTVGPVLFEDMLNDRQQFSRDWVVQMAQTDPHLERYARVVDGHLHVHDPRGSTIWFRHKLQSPVMITYRVMCPPEFNSGNDIAPRDINQFWMANDPEVSDPNAPGGLFDAAKYKGIFGSYDELHGYYASTGGGNAAEYNRTVRFRRYPRKKQGGETAHVAMNDKDDQREYLIVPDREHVVQLVAAGDIVQFILDGKIVYELKRGDVPTTEGMPEGEGNPVAWGEAPWTIYPEGYFGFRMTRSHHVYSDFKVYKLIGK